MKVLILSMTVGQGHNSAANALKKHMESRGHICEILDTYKFLNKAVGVAFDKGYTVMGRFWPQLNENIYSAAEKYNGRSDMKMYFPWLFADLNKAKMQKMIEEVRPDAIICTIVMTAMLVSLLKESNNLDSRIVSVGIITDYSLHPFWEYTDMDYFVCPNELMTPSLRERGIPMSKILPIGIPIDDKFRKSLSREEARARLGLEPDKYTILVSAGGMGFAGLIATAKEIDMMQNVQMAVVCGTNAKLYHKLNEIEFKNTAHILRFVDNMDEYMDACDIFITKPGGLSTSEAIAKRKPLILTKPMPGVENMNHAFLLNNSLAVHTNKYQPINEVIMQLTINESKLSEMRTAQERWGSPDSAKKLNDFIENALANG